MLPPSSSFARRLLAWYDRSRRDLPWRVPAGSDAPLDPYHVLVSETMLQQTQVATVIPYYRRFLARFPSLADLAQADEQEVLRLWQGLGYYSRARNLQAAAQKVMSDYGGQLPATLEELQQLPGVGRYTAGAVASIAFDRRAPILDGNVQRVLCRLDKVEKDPRDRQTQQYLWKRAEEILPRKRVGDFNSALMELGATICTPRSPQCLFCPVSAHCEAFATGLQDRIPAPKKARPTPLLRRQTFCIRRRDQWLLEQRPSTGRWAGMWQFITVEADGANGKPILPVKVKNPTRIGLITHGLTHRRYEFEVFVTEGSGRKEIGRGQPRVWVSLERLGDYPLPRPHLKIAQMLRNATMIS